ncbi:unnamed protein product [Pleuronectes platessa]|uniref:Uncharacterized protein n=1 Tax=Pleuronectes platessa TaxID=8262 RepID=A0A9N7YRQ5_PLEPL|nr:unnamed protein product [Pleuronectes platessa]
MVQRLDLPLCQSLEWPLSRVLVRFARSPGRNDRLPKSPALTRHPPWNVSYTESEAAEGEVGLHKLANTYVGLKLCPFVGVGTGGTEKHFQPGMGGRGGELCLRWTLSMSSKVSFHFTARQTHVGSHATDSSCPTS